MDFSQTIPTLSIIYLLTPAIHLRMDEVDDMQDVEEEQNGRPKQMQIENSNTQAKEIPDLYVFNIYIEI